MARGAKKEKATLMTVEKMALVPVEEQPYPVPENWCWVKMGAVCSFERGITFPASAKEAEPTADNIPCLRTANIQDELEIDDLIYVDKSYMKGNPDKLSRIDDIIMSSANSRELVGKTSYVTYLPCPMTFGGFVLTIRAQMVVSKYLFYFLRFEFLSGRFMGESTQTTNIANINTSKLSEYAMPFPCFTEQQRIVGRIENLFAKLDEAKEKTQAVVDGFEDRKAAILHMAFTGKLTEKWREANGVSYDSWNIRYIYQIGDVVTGCTPNTKQRELYGGDVPFIKPTELNQGRHVHRSYDTLTEEGRSVSRPVRAGSTCVCCIGATISKCGYLEVDAVTNQQINTIMPYDFMDDVYVYYFCCSKGFKDVLIENSSSTTLPIINKKRMSALEIIVPTKQEQTVISNALDYLFKKEQQAKDAAEQTLAQIDTIKKAILARAFHGELGTNDPADESAEELLKQVLKMGE